MCDYVTILAKTTEEAEVKNSQTAGAAWMRYAQVTPIFGSQKPFAVEGVTPIAKVLQFDMADGEPRLLVGTPTKSGGQITLLAERIFRIQTSEVDIYEKEMTAVHETLQGDKIQPVTSKRPADSMVQETPSKKFAPAFLAEWRRHLCFDVQLTCLARCSCLAGQILISKCCLQLRCPCLDWQRNHLRRRQTCFADEKMKSLRLLWPSVKWKHLFSHLISSMRSPDVVTQVHMACADIAHCWHDRTWQKKDGVSMACHQALFGNFHGCMHSNINSGVIVDGITLSWRHVLLAWSDCQPGSESDCVCVLYTRHTHVTVVVWWCFWLRLFIMTDLGFVLACIMWHMYPQPHMFERQMQVKWSSCPWLVTTLVALYGWWENSLFGIFMDRRYMLETRKIEGVILYLLGVIKLASFFSSRTTISLTI